VPSGKAGKYHLEGAARIASGASYVIAQLYWRLNGTTAIAGGSVVWLPNSAQSTMQIASCDVALAVGDYVELMAYQDSSGARNIGADSSLTTASIALIGV
jgi:hypothetical protein